MWLRAETENRLSPFINNLRISLPFGRRYTLSIIGTIDRALSIQVKQFRKRAGIVVVLAGQLCFHRFTECNARDERSQKAIRLRPNT